MVAGTKSDCGDLREYEDPGSTIEGSAWIKWSTCVLKRLYQVCETGGPKLDCRAIAVAVDNVVSERFKSFIGGFWLVCMRNLLELEKVN